MSFTFFFLIFEGIFFALCTKSPIHLSIYLYDAVHLKVRVTGSLKLDGCIREWDCSQVMMFDVMAITEYS